ncbi:DNA ligase 1 isoform X1 [Adelges cooleyi]|uniref:DNA ligase 1 isoform X1 n=2 Tax=Adelges cooleyi TaxID=133065 RepID=UPI002180301D|nr:DNA ligase 1 isoform X1 [Adelges cooleyi]
MSGNPPQRTTFRPPWVKDVKDAATGQAPANPVPWRNRDKMTTNVTNQPNAIDEMKHFKLRKVTPNDGKKVTEIKIVPRIESQGPLQVKKSVPVAETPAKPTMTSKAPPPTSNVPRPPPAAPPIPPPPPCAPAGPPPPPPMASMNGPLIVKKPPTPDKMKKIESLRSRPRRRPDWSDMMKEVESGRKLKHVECNDRSAPILPSDKSKDKFMYESETKAESTDHHQLLKDIQGGVKLRKVATNDRSKPNIEGLRKFRRQATIEEKIQKSVSMADVVAAAAEPDELDDIDKVRDDLQSAKQMLALELRSKEALERENKRLLARVSNLQEELQDKDKDKSNGHEPSRSEKDQQLMNKLKEEAAEADRIVKDMEQKYHVTAEELDSTRRKLESAWLRNQQLELELKAALSGRVTSQQTVPRQMSMKRLSVAPSVDHLSEEDEDEDDDDDDSSEDGSSDGSQEMDDARRTARELKLLEVKVKSLSDKQTSALKERKMLKQELAKRQRELKAEKKKYKVLQKEVDKMAKLMRETGEEDEDEDEEAEEQEEEESEEETETESEESDDEPKSEGEAPATATADEKKDNLNRRSKYYEGRLTSLKKGNYLLKANVERLQDDVNKQKEMSLVLQEDLNSVLAELG